MNMVDIHSHFLPHSWPDLAARFGGTDWPSMKLLIAEHQHRLAVA